MSYEEIGQELGKLIDTKQKAYGDSITSCGELLKIFMKKWKGEDGLYHIPESLLWHISMMVRIIDKQNRIFNNPDFDLMGENPYKDICGYGLLADTKIKERESANLQQV